MVGDAPRFPGIFFDKSLNLIVHVNGQAALNVEHSWADAPVTGHLLEHILVGELRGAYYEPDGHVRPGEGSAARCGSRLLGALLKEQHAGGRPRLNSPSEGADASAEPAAAGALMPAGADASTEGRWQRLSWALTAETEEAILAARATLVALGDNLDLVVTSFTGFGKGFIKRCGVSPDAFVQLALQLSFFRDQGRLDNTYESSMTRLFANGRTETVRPCTAEAAAFVALMVDTSGAAASPLAKLSALRRAADRHVALYVAAMEGRGLDRHLFALYCVAVGTATESLFLKAALSSPWRLSTSQVPQQQTTLMAPGAPEFQRAMSAGGGFSAVAEDGYGVSYSVAGEQELIFHVSSVRKGASRTSASRFTERIIEALADMRNVLAEALGDEAAAARELPPSELPLPPASESQDDGDTGGSPTAKSSVAAKVVPLAVPTHVAAAVSAVPAPAAASPVPEAAAPPPTLASEPAMAPELPHPVPVEEESSPYSPALATPDPFLTPAS